MKPTLGRVVIYTLSEDDAKTINKRRADFEVEKRRIFNDPGSALGYIGHFGNQVEAGMECAADVVRVWSEATVNLQVKLDGNDVLWRTSATLGDGPGKWAWPKRED